MRLLATISLVVLVTVGASTMVEAASLCQKGKKVRLRAGACKGKETEVSLAGSDVSGIWKIREGSGLKNGSFLPVFLTVNADGTGRLNEQEPTTHTLQCRPFRYALGNGTPTMTLDPTPGTIHVVQAARAGDVLTVTDNSGASVFDKATAVDASQECGTLTEVSRLVDLPGPSTGNTGLAFTGNSFVYRGRDGNGVIVNATTGVAGPPPNLGASSQARSPYAVESGDVWGTCFCGSVDVANRVNITTGTVVDSVSTGADLGHLGFIQGIAVPTAGQLVLFLNEFATSTQMLLVVNTAAEPDTLVSAVTFPVTLGSLASDGTTLWGLLGNGINVAVTRIDASTGAATGSFQIPTSTVGWFGLAASAGKLFVLGNTPDSKGVIATFNAPAS